MKWSLIWIMGLFSLSYAQDRPNVIFILVDDLGWKDVGFMGSSYYQTPHLDQLASESLVFTQGYAGASNCAPSRAVLMSGQATPRHGVYTVSPSTRGKSHNRKLIPTPNTRHLSDSLTTLAEAFKAGGYVSGHFGKWHVGKDPLKQGFDVNKGGSAKGNPGKGGYFSPYNVASLPDGPEGEYLTDRLTTESIRFIQENQDTSFFVYLPFYTVHTPLMGPKELVGKYMDLPPQNGQGHKKHYAAMVERMDANVGRIMATLKELDLSNTLIIFSSDNGGIASISRQWPLRAGKGSYYEGGIRVPLLFHWPERIKAGQNDQCPFTFLDMYPTLLGLLDLPIPDSHPLDGVDLSTVLVDDSYDNELHKRFLIWHFPIYLQAYKKGQDDSRDPFFRTRPGSIIRQGEWKLHQYFENNELELYNIPQDPGERINLAKVHPDKVSELLKTLNQWRESYQAPVPTELNPDFQP
ncbi:MAG: sulfatase [Bacteroidota bacterium]